MIKGQLGVVAAIVVLLITGALCLLVISDRNSKAEKATRARVTGAFQAVRTSIDLDADASKANAQRYADASRKLFVDLGATHLPKLIAGVTKAKAGLPEGWKQPDFIALLTMRKNAIWSTASQALRKGGAEADQVTNTKFSEDFIAKTVSTKTVGRQAMVGTLTRPKAFKKPLKVVAVPLGERLPGAILLGWVDKTDADALRKNGEAFVSAGGAELIGPLAKAMLHRWRQLQGLVQNYQADLMDRLKRRRVQVSFVGIADRRGVLLHGTSSEYEGKPLAAGAVALQSVMADHTSATTIWLKSLMQDQSKGGKDTERPSILRMGFAPIFGHSKHLFGIFIIAWELGDVHTRLMKQYSGVEVAYLHRKSIAASTAKKVAGAALSEVGKTVAGWSKPKIATIKSDESYLAAAAHFPQSGVKDYTYVVFASLDKARAPYATGMWVLITFGIISILLFLVVGWMTRRYFILPLDALEQGVAEIVNGDMEYEFGVPSRESEGLAYSLNVLMAQLLGRPEPGEEDEEETPGSKPTIQFVVAEGGALQNPNDPAVAQLIGEPEDAYYQRLFNEYVEIMKQDGEDVSTFTLRDFRQKVEVNERMVRARMKCSNVRFRLTAGEEGPVMNPVAT